MINTVTVTNHLGESLTMNLRFPEQSGFLIREITGLGPSKADINLTEVQSSDGARYNSARISSRNIVMTLDLLENPTIEDSRLNTYRYFPIKKPVTIRIATDRRTCQTLGYVESNTPDIFDKKESAVISIVCPFPYFYSTEDHVTSFAGMQPMFEFPFSNESLSIHLLIMGSIQSVTQAPIVYTGDAPVGITIYLHAVDTVVNPTITNTVTRESMTIDTTKLATLVGEGFISGDEIVISTIRGSKSITLIRSGVSHNILNCLDKDTDWFQIEKGDNAFTYSADSGLDNLQFRIVNRVLYEGV